MRIEPSELSKHELYRWMISIVVPRPIAFISTCAADGATNLAPSSYFIALSSEPPLVGVSFSDREGDPKDTLRNLRETGAFVVNVVNEALLEPMVRSSGEWPRGTSEFDVTGLTPAPSERVTSPSVAESPIQLECRFRQELVMGNGIFVVGEVVLMRIADEVLTEGRVDPEKLRPVGRLGGELYSLTREVVRVPRPRVARTAIDGTPSPSIRIPVKDDADLWTFTQRNVSLWDVLDFFPKDAIGPRGPSDAPRPYEVKPITVETDLGWSFETDIQFGAWMFRPRSPKQPGMMRWCQERGLEVGDAIVFERLGERKFRLRLAKRGSAG